MMRLVRSLLCLSLCVSSLSVAGAAHANQVQPAAPPSSPPTAPAGKPVTPTPAPEPTTAPEPPATTEPPPPSEPAPSAESAEPKPAEAETPPPPPTEEPVAEQPPPPPAPVQSETTIAVELAGSDAPPETHDGFFLRLAPGLGVSAWSKQLPAMPPDGLSLPVGGGEATFGGVGGALEIAVGAVVTDSLALHVTLFGATLSEPTLTVNENDLPDVNGRAFLASMLGVGATYYFMPANVYVSASFGLGGMRMVPKKGAKNMDTKGGFAWELLAGKEWWIAGEWGLGAALQVAYVNVPDQGERSSALAVNALLSVTYN